MRPSAETLEHRLARLEWTNRALVVAVFALGIAPWLLAATPPVGTAPATAPPATGLAPQPAGPPIAPLPPRIANPALALPTPPPITPMVRTRVIELVDVDGNRRAWIGTDVRKNPIVALIDAAGRERLSVLLDAASSSVVLRDSADKERVALRASEGTPSFNGLSVNRGEVLLNTYDGVTMGGMRVEDSAGSIWLNRAPNQAQVSITSAIVPGTTAGSKVRVGKLEIRAENGQAYASISAAARSAGLAMYSGAQPGFDVWMGAEAPVGGSFSVSSTQRGVERQTLSVPVPTSDVRDLLRTTNVR